MRFIHRLLRSLTLPNNAGPNDPQTIIGPDLKQAIVDYYDALGFEVVSNMVFQIDETHYNYIAQVIFPGVLTFLCFGSVGVTDPGGAPFTIETFRYSVNPTIGSVLSLGVQLGQGGFTGHASTVVGGPMQVDGNLTIASVGDLIYNSVSIVHNQVYTPAPTGTMNFGAGATVQGRYTQIGDRTWADAVITLGAAGLAIGDGQVSLPQTPVTNEVTLMGVASMTDTSAGIHYAGYTRRFGTGMRFEYANVVGASVQATVIGAAAPFAFATGDVLRFQCTYRNA